jgi:ribosomal protein L19
MQPANPILPTCLIMGSLKYLKVVSSIGVERRFNIHSGNLGRCIELVYVTPSNTVDRKCLVAIEGFGFKSCTGYGM